MKIRSLMLWASALLFAINLGFALGDITSSMWTDLFRDSVIAASNFIIFLTWKISPK